MKRHSAIALMFVVVASLLIGCGGEPDSSTSEKKNYPLPPPPGMAPGPSGGSESTGSDTASPTPETTEPRAGTSEPTPETTEPQAETSEPTEPAGEEMDRVKADVGAAKAGRSLDEYEGVVVTPAKSLFAVQERMVFQVQIPSALKLYEASNGSKPKSHEEFMTKIIQANQIRLPELPAGQRYAWDPDQGELMVEKPK